MRYEDIIADIENLVGLELKSIIPGSNITLSNVNREQGRLELKTAKGKRMVRPLSEIQKIWEGLCRNPVIYVERILDGAGPSRNQPETIMANLPYIEWLRIDKKKHLAFVGEATHPMGTLQQMDGVEAEKIRQRLQSNVAQTKFPTVIVIASDIQYASQNLEKATGLSVNSVQPGIYKQEHRSTKIMLVANSILPIKVPPGTYAVVRGKSVPKDSIPVEVAGEMLYATNGGGMHIMVSIS